MIHDIAILCSSFDPNRLLLWDHQVSLRCLLCLRCISKKFRAHMPRRKKNRGTAQSVWSVDSQPKKSEHRKDVGLDSWTALLLERYAAAKEKQGEERHRVMIFRFSAEKVWTCKDVGLEIPELHYCWYDMDHCRAWTNQNFPRRVGE